MHCAACQSRVQSALQKTSGVSDASVNLLLNSATITYDEGAVAPEKLVEAIKSTGYSAELPNANEKANETADGSAEEEANEKATSALKKKTAVSLTAAAIGMLLPMAFMHATWMPWALFVIT